MIEDAEAPKENPNDFTNYYSFEPLGRYDKGMGYYHETMGDFKARLRDGRISQQELDEGKGWYATEFYESDLEVDTDDVELSTVGHEELTHVIWYKKWEL